MSQELIERTAPLTAVQIRGQVNLIQEVMKQVMQEGQHYGKIPGCGDKPTLLKPGAEKLSMTFRLRPIIDNERDINIERLNDGHIEVRVYCHVMNMDGVELATGVGSCSTMESKYRYRGGEKISTGRLVPKEYWNLDKAGKKQEALETIGGPGFGVGKFNGQWEICEKGEKMENPDIADTYNTVLKMAKKRAYVDGILSSTGASDIFTQDLEDLPIANADVVVEQPKATSKPAVAMPQEIKKEPVKAVDLITLLQGKKDDEMSVVAFFQSVEVSTKPDKNDKNKTWTISEYTVADLPTEGTVETVIKSFGDPVQAVKGKAVVFANVKIGEYNGKLQYVAREVSVSE